jgi:uncharacterized tellurite resistance protein B-like protein
MSNENGIGQVAGFAIGGAADVADAAEVVVPAIGHDVRHGRPGGWFTKLVTHYVKRNAARLKAKPRAAETASASDRAKSAIRWACVKSAVSGAAAGCVSTGATLFTAQTEGLGGLVAGPIAALAIGGEMIYRAIVHVDLSCELASIFEVEFDPNDDADIWRLYAVAFGTHQHDEETEDPGKELVSEVTHIEGEQVGEKIGQKVLGESVMRNIIPIAGIVTSAVTNFMMTRRLGDTVRRYMRYQHALGDVAAEAVTTCNSHLDLLIEGLWFIFSADGKLTPEEAAFLAHMLKKLDPIRRHALIARFVEDELDWTVRLKTEVPPEMRDMFMRVLEVAAAVDKEVGLPERKILRRAARSLGREFSQERVEQMIREFEENGVLSDPSVPAAAAAHAQA